jgi:hypothetical protein
MGCSGAAELNEVVADELLVAAASGVGVIETEALE